MADEAELAGLDPFDIADRESSRLDRFFSGIAGEQWTRPTRCEGWNVRDLLGHLAAVEEYHLACVDGTAASLLERFAARGATDMDALNGLGVADRAELPAAQVLAEWRAANADARRGFRQRRDGTVDSSVGAYSSRLMAFHHASELATHADDLGVPVGDTEREERRRWRAGFSRFALAEAKPALTIDVVRGRTVVSDGTTTVDLDDDELIEAVVARLGETSRLDAAARRMLSVFA